MQYRYQWLTLFFLLLIPCLIWYQQTGDLTVYFSNTVPPGQSLYVLSKLTGMIALVCIAWQLIATLLDKLQWLPLHWLGVSHQRFGAIVVVTLLTHLLLFFSAVSLRQEKLAWGLWLPDFRDFYHTHLSLGLFALWALCVVAIVGYLRSKYYSAITRRLHQLYWPAIALVYFHALAVGSEAQSPLGMLLYISLGGIIILLGCAYMLKQLKTIAALSQ